MSRRYHRGPDDCIYDRKEGTYLTVQTETDTPDGHRLRAYNHGTNRQEDLTIDRNDIEEVQ